MYEQPTNEVLGDNSPEVVHPLLLDVATQLLKEDCLAQVVLIKSIIDAAKQKVTGRGNGVDIHSDTIIVLILLLVMHKGTLTSCPG